MHAASLIRPHKVTQLSGVHDPVKEYLIRVLFSKPHTVCNLWKVLTCSNFLIIRHMYMMVTSCLLFVSANSYMSAVSLITVGGGRQLM